LSINTANTAKRPEYLEKMMGKVTPRHEPEVEEAEERPKEKRGAIPTPMLDVVFRSGEVESLGYAYLKRVRFRPGDTLILEFTSGETVVIDGRNLARLRQSVRLHRADEIRESSETELMQDGQGVSQVERIHITEGDTE
jgi:hypothetical protein